MTKMISDRFGWLDALRGIAALLVAIYHLFEILKLKFPSESVLSDEYILNTLIKGFLDFGKIGVALFFIISGYVIPKSLENRSIKQFVIGRIFRLYPAYWITILLFTLLVGISSYSQFFFNLTMFQKFFGKEDLVGVFWTLQIELIFYFICILLSWKNMLHDKLSIRNVLYIIMIIGLGLSFARYKLDIKLPVAIFLALSLMFLGFALRMYKDFSLFSIKEILIYNISFIVILLIICFLAYNRDYGFHETWYIYFFSYLTGVILFYLFYLTSYSNKVFVFLGMISYSVYLLHPIVMELLQYFWRKELLLNIYLSSIIFLIITFGLSTLNYFIIEKPFQVLGKKLMSRNVK